MRRVESGHYDFLYDLATDPAIGHRWRYRGSTPAPDAFVRDLWGGVLAQFLIERTSGDPIGLVTAYEADSFNGTAYIGVAASRQYLDTGLAIEGSALFLHHLFDVFPLRQVYAEVPGFIFKSMGNGLLRYFVEEGRLRDYSYFDGRYWDLHILTLRRSDWAPHDARLCRLLV